MLAALLAAPLDGQGRTRRARGDDAKKIFSAAMKLLDHKDSTIWLATMDALAKLKGTAVPYLIQRVRDSAPEGLDTGAVRAVQVLDRIGARAVAAVPTLLDTLPDAPERMQTAIVLALGRLAPHTSKHRARIREAMVELVVNDANVRQLRPELVAYFRQFIQLHQEAWRTHARTQLDADASVETLLTTLEDSNPFLREFAAELLAKPRRRNEAAVVALAKTLGEEQPGKAVMDDVDEAGLPQLDVDIYYDRRIKSQVARALVRMAPDDKRALPAFELLLERPISELRLEGLIALRRAGPLAEKLLPTVLRMAKREDTVIQREAVTVLGMIGPKAREAIPTLKKLARGGDKQLAARAKAALLRIDP